MNNVNDEINLAAQVTQDRLDRRMSWPEYAAWIGIKQTTIYKIARGKTPTPHATTVEQIRVKLREPVILAGAAAAMAPASV